MKRIETKFIALLLCCVIGCAALIGGVSIVSSHRVLSADASQILNLLCEKYSGEIDALMGRIEQSVDSLASYTLAELESVDSLRDPDYLAAYVERLESAVINTAYSTDGALTVYVRFEPELTTPTAGMFWGREEEDGLLRELQTTDMDQFDATDETMKWYYMPVGRGVPTWIAPYRNQPMDMLIISYVVPLYVDGTLVGIVGMDIDCRVLEQLVNSISVYETGHAFMLDAESGLNYHPQHNEQNWSEDVPEKIIAAVNEAENGIPDELLQLNNEWDNAKVYLTFRELKNGMYLVVSTPVKEINAQRNELLGQIVLIVTLALTIGIIGGLFFTRRVTAPLKKLSEAAYQVAAGNTDVVLPEPSEDEVGTLSLAFREMLMHIQWHDNQMHALAYKDALTGVKNKTAWDEASLKMLREIESGSPAFAVAVFDVNDLKITNDTQGHEAGDKLLKDACTAICDAFVHSPVFRIGGDEFAAILERQDYENRAALMEQFRARMSAPDATVRVAGGMAEYIPGVDHSFNDVFSRGDAEMYENKRMLKEMR